MNFKFNKFNNKIEQKFEVSYLKKNINNNFFPVSVRLSYLKIIKTFENSISISLVFIKLSKKPFLKSQKNYGKYQKFKILRNFHKNW